MLSSRRGRSKYLGVKVAALALMVILVLLASTTFATNLLRMRSDGSVRRGGWQETDNIRIVMDSTSDWARMMFNDINGGGTNGVRVVEFGSHGWLSGNHSDYRIDAGRGLTFVDVLYNRTVIKTGDIVGFFKGNNDFSHTRMFADVLLAVNRGMSQISFYLILAGAGRTTFQIIDKQTGGILWQDSEGGNSFTQYVKRSMSPDIFFLKEQIGGGVILTLMASAVILVASLNILPSFHKTQRAGKDESGSE